MSLKKKTEHPVQFIWYNKYLKIDNNTIYYLHFSEKSIDHIRDLFENNGRISS